MKKMFIFCLCLSSLFITGCGCSKKELKTITCVRNEEYEKYSLDSTITITYDDNNQKINSFDELSILKSSDEAIRNYFKEVNDKYYASYGKYYNSFVESNKATMSIELDFEKLSVDEFLGLNVNNDTYLTNDKIDYQKIISYYTEFENYECH